MRTPEKPSALNIIQVELTIFARIVGKQSIKKTRTLTGVYSYSLNNRVSSKEEIYSLLVTAGFPPGHSYLEIFLSDDTSVVTTGPEKIEKKSQEDNDDEDLKADIYIILDNRSKALKMTEDFVSFTKKYKASSETEYYITEIRCRHKDIRDLFTGAGIKPGTPVYDALLDCKQLL